VKTLLTISFVTACTLHAQQGATIGAIVKGSPYSALATTEKTQTLADGNKIVQQTSSMIYRDSQGRERRNVSRSALTGSFVVISDPVAGETWTLNPLVRTAQKLNLPALPPPPAPSSPHSSAIGVRFALRAQTAPGVMVDSTTPGSAADQGGVLRGDVITALNGQTIRDANDLTTRVSAVPVGSRITLTIDRHGTPIVVTLTTQDRANVFKQTSSIPSVSLDLMRSLAASGLMPDQTGKSTGVDLGTQAFEGVEARGTRTTVPVPAGVLGNVRAFDIVNETWYSPELQVIVMEKHSDPRTGDTLFRLTEIKRADLDPSLFQVPKDYNIPR
jgi:hypothetical protein